MLDVRNKRLLCECVNCKCGHDEMPTPVSYSSMIRNQIAFDLAISDVDRKQNRIVISASTKEIFDKVYDFASQGCSTWLVNDKGETLNLDIIGVNEAKV